MRLPDFFILGAPKCGTSALAKFIAVHPDVCISSPKEPHFFDGSFDEGVEVYSKKYFSNCTDASIIGEATPTYLTLPYVAERIKTHVPNAKLIIVLRNPVERAYSLWWMLYCRGMEVLDFSGALEAEKKQGPVFSDNALLEERWSKHVVALKAGDELPLRTYVETGRYVVHIESYLKHFSRANIKIVTSDDLRVSPASVIQDLWEFIGVSDKVEVNLQDFAESVNSAHGSYSRYFLVFLRATKLMSFRHKLSEDTRGKIKNWLSKAGRKPPMDEKTRDQLQEYFRPYNTKLCQLYDVNTEKWNS